MQLELGPGSTAARALLAVWEGTDWFEPPPDEEAARSALVRHQRLAHAIAPDLAPPPSAVSVVRGGWPELSALAGRARATKTPAFDWKFGVLKALGKRHTTRHGWSRAAVAPDRTLEGPRPGDAVFRFGGSTIWTTFGPSLPLREALPKAAADVADWYVTFAHADLIEAIEWQLARGDDDLSENPFAALVACYAAGGLPFVLGATQPVLFTFLPPS